MDYLQEIHRLIVLNEREIRALKARLASFSSGGTILSGSLTPHGLLSAAHPDTVPAGAEENFIIIGNPSNLWQKRALFDDTSIADPGVSLFPARNDHGHEAGSGESLPTVLVDLSGLTDGVETVFLTPDVYEADSTRVWQNGLMLRPIIDYDEDVTLDAITLVVAPTAGDELLIEYLPQEA